VVLTQPAAARIFGVWRDSPLPLEQTTCLTHATMQIQANANGISCEFCKKPMPSRHRLRQHISMTAACRRANEAKFRAVTGRAMPRPSRRESEEGGSTRDSSSEDEGGARQDADAAAEAVAQFMDSPAASELPPSPPLPSSAQLPAHDPRIEDVPDEDDIRQNPPPHSRSTPSGFERFVEPYPEPAGIDIGVTETVFERIRREQQERGDGRYGVFKDEQIWEVARFMVDCVGHNDAERFLKLALVSVLRREMCPISHISTGEG
jgi:hypothetical protein